MFVVFIPKEGLDGIVPAKPSFGVAMIRILRPVLVWHSLCFTNRFVCIFIYLYGSYDGRRYFITYINGITKANVWNSTSFVHYAVDLSAVKG